jgi:hypothetical protein
MPEILRNAHEWAEHYGTQILDPDGWREDNTPLETPISQDDFLRRWSMSTVSLIPAIPEAES